MTGRARAGRGFFWRLNPRRAGGLLMLQGSGVIFPVIDVKDGRRRKRASKLRQFARLRRFRGEAAMWPLLWTAGRREPKSAFFDITR